MRMCVRCVRARREVNTARVRRAHGARDTKRRTRTACARAPQTNFLKMKKMLAFFLFLC